MNKKFTMKSLFLTLMLLVSAGAWAGVETITFSEKGYDNAAAVETVNGDDFTITFDKGTNNNAPKYYNAGTAVRAYGGNYFTVASDNTITSIVLGFGSGDGSNAITTDEETYDNGTWTGSANAVKFTIGGTSGNRRIASITVTTADSGTPDESVETTVTIDATGITNTDVYESTVAGKLVATVKAGEDAVEGATVTWSSDKETVATVDEEGNVTLVAAGTANIKASYAGESGVYKASFATYELTVTSSAPVTLPNPVVFSELGLENSVEVTEVKGNGFTITFDKGTSSNAPKYYTTGEAVRAYGGNTMTVTSSEKNIAKIILTFASGEGTNEITTDEETYDNGTWTGSASAVKFTVGGTSGHRRIASVEVEFEDGTPVAVTGIALDKTELEIAVGKTAALKATFTPANATNKNVTWTSSDKEVATVENGTVTAVAEGTATITVKTEDGEYTATCDVTVVAASVEKGTEDNPYTVAEAIEAAATGATGVYAKGIISQIDSYNSNYNSITYWISDDGTTTTQLEVYSGKNLNNTSFSGVDDLTVGDKVTVYGNLKMYNTTPEFDKNNYIVSIEKYVDERKDAGIAYEQTEYNVSIYETEGFVAPTLTNPNNLTVTYSSSNEDLAVVEENTGEIVLEDLTVGTVTITATFAGNEEYKEATASYTIKLYDPDANDGSKERPYTVAEVIDGTAKGTGYVKGYITGAAASKINFDNTSKTNFVLSATPTETTIEGSSVPVQLPNNDLRTQNNVADNPTMIGTLVLVKGECLDYFQIPGVKNTTEIIPVAKNVTIGETGKATLSYKHNLDFEGTDVEAYTAALNGSRLTLTKENVIPAETGVIIEGEAGSYDIPVTEKTAEVESVLAAALTDYTAQTGDFVLTKQNDNVVFAPAAEGLTVKAGKAYLPAAAIPADAKVIYFEDEATGIQSMKVAENNGAYYTISGLRVAQPTKGLYIHNGKKVVVK